MDHIDWNRSPVEQQDSRMISKVPEAWRLDDEGQLDDICLPDVECFRMERMDVNYWWIGLYCKDGRRIHIDLCATSEGVMATKRVD